MSATQPLTDYNLRVLRLHSDGSLTVSFRVDHLSISTCEGVFSVDRTGGYLTIEPPDAIGQIDLSFWGDMLARCNECLRSGRCPDLVKEFTRVHAHRMHTQFFLARHDDFAELSVHHSNWYRNFIYDGEHWAEVDDSLNARAIREYLLQKQGSKQRRPSRLSRLQLSPKRVLGLLPTTWRSAKANGHTS